MFVRLKLWLPFLLLAAFPGLVGALGTLKIDYFRFDSSYAGWGTHLWDAGSGWGPTSWTAYPQFLDGPGTMAQFPYPSYTTGTETVGTGPGAQTFRYLSFDASALSASATLKFLVHQGDTKDMGGSDQTWPTSAGAPVSTIYCVQGNTTIFTDPAAAAAATVNDLAAATITSPTHVAVYLLGVYDGTTAFSLSDGSGTAVPATLTMTAGNSSGTLTTTSALDFTKAPFSLKYGTNPGHLVSATGAVVDQYLTPDPAIVLGPVYSAGGVTLTFWSPFAKTVKVDFYTNSGDPNSSPASQLAMTQAADGTGVWTLPLASVPTTNAYYQFEADFGEATGPRHVLDPYAKAMGLWRQKAWAATDPVGKGYLVDPTASGPTGGWANYGATSGPYFDGSALASGSYAYHSNRDAIIYEASVRDLTSDPSLSSIGTSRGTYGAFQKVLPHIKNLGVTHVQLMPVLQNYFYDQAQVGTYEGGTSGSKVTGNNYNWGYDPHNYFTPTGMYSANPSDPNSRITEMKDLVNAVHKAGMGVILDVVFNHTATVNVLNDAVPGYYYRLNNLGGFLGNSGCGNDVKTEAKMTRKLIVDSIVYWVSQYKVDGFRFDIMGLVDTGTLAAAYQAAKAINPHVIFEGEGWQGMYDGAATDYVGKAIAGGDQAHTFLLNGTSYTGAPTPAGMFNDGIRSLLKGGGMSEGPGFLTGASQNLQALFQNIAGRPSGYTAATADYVMSYMTVHDNLCLYDAVANGMHLTASTADTQTALDRIRVGYTAVLTSQGTSFLYGGDELLRSREISSSAPGNVVTDGVTGRTFVGNAYNATDAMNQIPWLKAYSADPVANGFTNLDSSKPGAQLYQYLQGLVALRKSTDAFRLADGLAGPNLTLIAPDN